MSKKQSVVGVFVKGELVHDEQYNETFVYMPERDKHRKELGKLRCATEQEKAEFERFMNPNRP